MYQQELRREEVPAPWPGVAIRFFLLVIAFILQVSVFAQSKKELEKKKEQLRQDIQYTNELLSQTKKNKSASLSQLIALNQKITYRTELISTINTELNVVEHEIGYVSTHIDSLNSRLNGLKKQYAEMLYYAYKNQGNYSRLAFIFSSETFSQAYKRMQYLRQLSDYRMRQRDRIVQVQDSLSGKKRMLQDVKQDKSRLLTAQVKEKRDLSKEKKQQVSVLNNLTVREKKLRADLREKQRKEQLLASRIEDIIRKEIESARTAARKKSASSGSANVSTKKIENVSSPNATSVLASTPEAIKLSNDFESNKGRLPWPVEQGIISSSFGRHAHPVWRDVVVNNNGIDINSRKGAKARAIFDGRVLRVLMVVDKYAILVQHGEYFTLYSNLQEVFVKAGDKVITKQPIGLVQTNEDEGKTEVHLEIWRGSNKMDPEGWLAAKR
ncbi:MAG TPA: peptidoglycan DD-metalloendopeptidase family protein [Bacteroidia bacterium]|nr:peptidoglycan DD-metalloendopeptidase family protein [Bacteroidia bacterium]